MRRPLALVLVLALSAPLAAQTAVTVAAADTTLPEVTVTAARLALPPRDAGARVTLVGREAVEATAAVDVADVLERRAPLFVRRYGPSGLASLALRGTGGAQTLVLLDGRRISDPQLGQLDVSLLPAVLLDGVEVLHGGGSALYGTDALGGVVHLRATRPQAAPSLRATSEAGAWGQRRLGALATAGAGPLAAVVAVEGEQARDDFPYRDVTRLGAPVVLHEGWDRRRVTAYTALGYARGPNAARAAVWLAEAERGLGGTDTVGERQWDRHARVWLDAERQAVWGRLAAGGLVQRASLRYASPYPATRADALDETGRTTTASLDLTAHVTARAGWHLAAGTAGGLGRADHPSLADDATDGWAAGFLAGARTAGRLRLYPSVRLDGYAPAGAPRRAALSPGLGLNWRPRLASDFRVKASAARAFRMPTLNDRFWRPGGNPDLRPEQGWTADGGLAWARGPVQAELTAFAAGARDQIVWRPTGAGYWAPENVARTRTRGLEASAAGAASLGGLPIEVGGAATFTDARDRSSPDSPAYDQPLRYVPRWTGKAWAGLALGPIRLDVGAQAVGRRPTTADASQSLAPYLVLDGQARYTRAWLRVRATLALAVENLTDARYEVVQSYPMPPRHARLRLLIDAR